MRKRIGLCSQAATSSRRRISSSTALKVPKKRKPWSFITCVWRPMSLMKARWVAGRRTVDFAVEPSNSVRRNSGQQRISEKARNKKARAQVNVPARIARRREDWTTKKKQAMTMPKRRPKTKSQIVMPIVMATIVMYSNAVTL